MILHPNTKKILETIKKLREERNVTTESIEDELNIGKGWVKLTEKGNLYPSFDFVLAILKAAEIDLDTFTENLDKYSKGRFLSRVLNVDEKTKSGQECLEFIFQYEDYKASYI